MEVTIINEDGEATTIPQADDESGDQFVDRLLDLIMDEALPKDGSFYITMSVECGMIGKSYAITAGSHSHLRDPDEVAQLAEHPDGDGAAILEEFDTLWTCMRHNLATTFGSENAKTGVFNPRPEDEPGHEPQSS